MQEVLPPTGVWQVSASTPSCSCALEPLQPETDTYNNVFFSPHNYRELASQLHQNPGGYISEHHRLSSISELSCNTLCPAENSVVGLCIYCMGRKITH